MKRYFNAYGNDCLKNGHANKRAFSYFFIFLLFMAELFSVPNGGAFAESGGKTSVLDTISCGQVSCGSEAAFTAGIRCSGHDDLEINRNLETISGRNLSVKEGSYSYKQNRHVSFGDSSVFVASALLFALWFYRQRIFIVLGACFSFSLRFIIKYIHHKNGEKIEKFLSDRYFAYQYV